MNLPEQPCRECGKPFKPRQHGAMFCDGACRQDFNKRRRDRGAELYDVFMAARVDKIECVADVLKGLQSAYLAADKAKRNGRRSWQDWKYTQTRLPLAYSNDGDKR